MGKKALASFAAPLLAATVSVAQIKPYSRNPSYWQYQGKPVLLLGASDRDNVFQWAGEGARLTDHLDRLVRCGGDYLRCTMSSRSYEKDGYYWDRLLCPFAKTAGKYDLTKWDEAYWGKLRTLLCETKKRRVVVQLEFWDRWNEAGHSGRPRCGWYASPWNPNNNVTYDWADSPLLAPGSTGFYNPIHRAAVTGDPVLLPLQQRFVRKVIDEVIDGGFDHVLFQVDNESGIGQETLQPDPYWARLAREHARSRGAGDVYVCTQRRFHGPSWYQTTTFQDWKNPEIHVPILDDAFNYCDISQNNGCSGQTHYDNVLWYRSKVLEHGARPINNTKSYHFNWPIGTPYQDRQPGTDAEAGARLWRAVFAGAAAFRFHRRTEYVQNGMHAGFGLTPVAEKHLASMRALVTAIHLFTMEPRNDLLSEREPDEAYCLAEPGSQFAVFFTGIDDRSVTLDSSSLAEPFELRWLSVSETRWTKAPARRPTKTSRLHAPEEGHWVAVLRPRKTANTSEKQPSQSP